MSPDVMPHAPDGSSRPWPAGIIFCITGLLWAVHFLPFLSPSARLWGINHLIFLPPVYAVLYAVVGIIILAVCAPPVNKPVESWFTFVAEKGYGVFQGGRWIVLWFVFLVILWLCRIPVSMLGDGYFVTSNMAGAIPPIYKWPEQGATAVIHLVSQVLPSTGWERGTMSFAIISVLSGAATICLYGMIARELARDNPGRFLIFMLLACSGASLLFVGYAEHYPIVWPFVAGYVYAAIRYLAGKGGLLIPAVLLGLAAALHLQALMFVPSYILILFSRGKGAAVYARHPGMIWSAMAALAVITISCFVWQYTVSMRFFLYFVPFLSGRPDAPGYTLFSPTHIGDILNQLLLIFPLFPLFVVLCLRRGCHLLRSPLDRFLLVLSLGGVLFLVAIDPKLGMGRDWDLFALSGLGPILYLSRRYVAAERGVRVRAGLALMTGLLTAPFFLTHFDRETAIDHVRWLMDLDRSRSRSGLNVLAAYYSRIGDEVRADSVEREILERFPAARTARDAYESARVGDTVMALRMADELFRMNPYSVESYNVRGYVSLSMGRYREAIEDLETSVQLGGYDFAVYNNLAAAYAGIGEYDRMRRNLYRSLALNPTNVSAVDGLATGYFLQNTYDSALSYAERLIRSDPSRNHAYWVAGYSALQLHDSTLGIKYLRQYLRTGPGEGEQNRVRSLLRQIEKSPPSDGGDDDIPAGQ